MSNEAVATEVRAPAQGHTLAVSLRLKEDGPEVLCEPVTQGDLVDVYSEAWLAACLRKGRTDVPLDDLEVRLPAVFDKGDSRTCVGFVVDAAAPGGEASRCGFTSSALEDVARRGSQRLIESGVLKSGDLYYYEVVATDRRERLAPPPEPEAAAFSITAKHPPLAHLRVPLEPLLEQAEAVGPTADAWLPVLLVAAEGRGK